MCSSFDSFVSCVEDSEFLVPIELLARWNFSMETSNLLFCWTLDHKTVLFQLCWKRWRPPLTSLADWPRSPDPHYCAVCSPSGWSADTLMWMHTCRWIITQRYISLNLKNPKWQLPKGPLWRYFKSEFVFVVSIAVWFQTPHKTEVFKLLVGFTNCGDDDIRHKALMALGQF